MGYSPPATYANRIIKQLKDFKKSYGLDDSYTSYKAIYRSIPHLPPLILPSRMYINGHFCCALKFCYLHPSS